VLIPTSNADGAAKEGLVTDTELCRKKEEYATGLSSAVCIVVEPGECMTMLPSYSSLAVEMERASGLNRSELSTNVDSSSPSYGPDKAGEYIEREREDEGVRSSS
jgi:hypothetical protein